MNPADPDLWHRLALGEALWQTGHFPPGDTFSYLADYQNVADHEWGSALIFYPIYAWGGGMAMVVLKIVTLGITMILVISAALRQRPIGALLTAFYAVVLLALLPNFASTLRCMSFTHILLALWVYWFQCERFGRPIRTVWYVLTMILWANLHGGFVTGLAWLFLITGIEAWYGGAWKKWAVRFGLCALATLVNPFGIQLWISTARALTAPRRGFSEWAPVTWWPEVMAYPGYKLLLVGLIAALVVRIIRVGWKEMDRPVMMILGVFIALSLTSARHTSLFGVVAGALAPGLFPQETTLRRIRNPLNRLGYMGLFSTLLIVPLYIAFMILPGDGLSLRYESASCPVAAVDYLKAAKITGNLLVPFNYGSYALWELRGKMRVSMDGRYDLVYRPETYQRVDDFFLAQGNWKSLLVSPPPQAVLLSMADAVYPKLKEDPAWTEAWHDDVDAVFLPK